MRDALGSWASITLTITLFTITISPLVSAGERWSRQLTELTGGPVTGNDWIPLSRPGSERQAGARVLNYFTSPQQTFLDPDSAAQTQQHHFTFLNHQFPQSNRFLLQQSAPQQHQPAQELLEQPFHLSSFQRTSPFVGQTIQHPPPPPPQPASSTNPFEQQFLSKPPVSEALIQEDKQQPLHDQRQQPSLLDQPFSYQHIRQPEIGAHPIGPQSGPSGAVSQEEVQLLYVPVETLYNQKQMQPAPENNRFNTLPQPVSPSLINDFYTAGTTTTTPKPPRTSAATFAPRYTSATDTPTPASSRSSTSTLGGASPKPKPNQPPLALFLYNDGRQGKLSTGDALGGLKNVNEIAVLDAFGKNTPKVFIGPSGLTPSKSYSRFDLPYLSSVDLSSNRANRKIEDLPFFVAPLSYKTPSGYSKIALPAPHVGSIIVRQSSSNSGNSLEQNSFFTRPTAPNNVQYYTPSTLNFDDSTTPTKAPITLGASGKPIYDSDHYTSPTAKSVPSIASNDRGVGHFGSFSNTNPLSASRHPSVNEEYFNLAKTKKPTTTPNPPPTTPNYPFRSYGSTRQFDFKPMPDQKIPPSFYPQGEDDSATTLSSITTTTERPTTAQLQFEAERMRTHFREENFRSRRPHHHQPTTPASLSESKPQEQQQFVHKFKLVDSVRPNNVKSSVVDHGFLDFFNTPSQQHTDEMIKTTITTSLPGHNGADRQVIRNNYFTASAAINEDTGTNRHSKFVSTYYNPSSTAAGTAAETTTPSTFTTQDVFFRDFDHRSKFYESEPKYETSFPTTVGTTGTSYLNKYKYEKDSYNDAPRYSVEVVTTSEPTTSITEPTPSTIDPQHYSIPSELPPISANLPGLVNALMDDQWPLKASDTAAATGNTRAPHFRKQLHRTTTQVSVVDSYGTEPASTTTRRPLQRQRRPHPSRTTPAPTFAVESVVNSGPSTRAPISRSRSRYVPNNDEHPSSRGRSRSRTTTPRAPRREEENLDYQRDVLKQNYPVIRPQGQGASVPTTTPLSTTIATTASTTLSNQETYEEMSERLISTTLANDVPLDSVDPQQQVTRKYSTYYSDSTYEQEQTVSTVLPPQTSSYYVPSYGTRSQTGDRPEEDEYVRPQEVTPLNHDPEPTHSVIPLRTHTPVTETSPKTAPPAIQYLTEKEKSEEKLTTGHDQPLEEAMELKKMEITPRPRRPGLVSRQRDTQQNYASRTTTERTTTARTMPETVVSGTGSRTASGRRPAFVRRPSRLYGTTTVSPITTAGYSNEQQQQSTHETNTVRTKNRQDILRGRTRRPTTTTEPAAAATTASPEAPVTRAFGRGNNLRRISPTLRSRQEQTATATTQQPSTVAPPGSGPRFRIRERTRFNLQPQESQWSAKLNHNSFQPVLKTESRANDLEQEGVSIEPEPEIVTAARDNEMYFLNVSSNYGQKDSSNLAVNAEDSTETSVPSFADLLNDVMKDFIDDNSQKKADRDSDEKDQASTEEQRRPVANFRNNFLRKRGRSKVVDSFETAESQHINQAAQVYNEPSHFGESFKSIDLVGLSGKNAPQQNNAKYAVQREIFEEHENTAQEQTTVAPAEIAAEETETEEASVEVVTGFAEVDISTTSTPPTTTTRPTKEVPTLPSLEQTSTSLAQEQDHAEITAETPTTVAPVYDDESSFLVDEVAKKKVSDGIFADVKKTLSDLYEMAEHDTESEEMVDGGEPAGIDGIDDEDFQPTEDPLSLGGSFDDQVTSTTDISPSETQFVQVTAEPPTPINPMGSLIIPTSVSNGITHETEICYRGRCIKTEDDKRKRKFKLN